MDTKDGKRIERIRWKGRVPSREKIREIALRHGVNEVHLRGGREQMVVGACSSFGFSLLFDAILDSKESRTRLEETKKKKQSFLDEVGAEEVERG